VASVEPAFENAAPRISLISWSTAAVIGLVLFLLVWTGHWASASVALLKAETALFSGAWRPTLEMHEVFEAKFVALHCVLRWAPGALVAGAGLYYFRRRARQA
jgi:hypothetical protein